MSKEEKELIVIPNDSGADVEKSGLGSASVPAVTNGKGKYADLYADLLAKAARIFKKEGITSATHLKAALITLIATNSAHLGEPLIVVLTADDRAKTTKILDAVSRLTPTELLLEFSIFDTKILSVKEDTFKQKAVIGFNSKGFKKGAEDLFALVERSTWTNHIVKTHGQNRTVERAESCGPTSWVTVAGDDNDNQILQNPFVLRIQIDTEKDTLKERLLSMAGRQLSFNVAEELYSIVKTGFLRLGNSQAHIPFASDLVEYIYRSELSDVESKFEIILRILKNIVKINNSPPVTDKEVIHRLIDHPSTIVIADPITATRKDYFYLWLLINGIIPTGRDAVTPRQERVFNAIKKQAEDYMFSVNAFSSQDTEREMLRGYNANTRSWSDKDKIIELMSQGGSEKLSQSMLYRTLEELVQKKLINKMKDPEDSNNKRIIYQIATLSLEAGLRLPDPSTVSDPANPPGTMQVVNPLTGEMVTI